MISQRDFLHGLGIALVTPFRQDLSIDYDALDKMIEYVIEGKTDYLVILGTTAETPTISVEERRELRRFVVEKVKSRVPLVLGMGNNNTHALCQELKSEDLNGFSAILSVVPFYNKPTQEGMYLHFSKIAEAIPLPVILYNVPGRTGTNMDATTTLRLARDFPGKIVATKEASGNLSQIEKILKYKPEGFKVISGDDALTYPLMSLGASGVISVLGNAFPVEFSKMVHLLLKGKNDEALNIHRSFEQLYHLIFVDGNPAGVKAILHKKGLIENTLRLPLTPVTPKTSDEISRALEIL